MNGWLLLLADGDKIPDVDKAIDWAERASQLGVAGLALFIMFLCIAAVVWLWKKNAKLMIAVAEGHQANSVLEKEYRGAETAFRGEVRTLEKQFRDETKELLREMLDRGEDDRESRDDMTQATRDMTQAMQQLAARVEYVERSLHRPGGGVGP